MKRVVNQPVFETIFGVAFFVDAVGKQGELGGREWIGGQTLHPVGARDHVAGVIERW